MLRIYTILCINKIVSYLVCMVNEYNPIGKRMFIKRLSYSHTQHAF